MSTRPTRPTSSSRTRRPQHQQLRRQPERRQHRQLTQTFGNNSGITRRHDRHERPAVPRQRLPATGGNTNFGGNQSVGNSGIDPDLRRHRAGAPRAVRTRPGCRTPAGGGPTRPRARRRRFRARSVFVVHGRDDEVRREMYEPLRRLDLRPSEWEDLVRATGHASPSSVTWSPAPGAGPGGTRPAHPRTTSSPPPDLQGHNEPDYETRPGVPAAPQRPDRAGHGADGVPPSAR
ncbi:nucleotide-binding protein [Streptomyces thinghirensis]|nr:nucleotide-binding protein [Streptomyces thinghirensis]